MAELIFYQQIASLDRAKHGAWKLNAVTDYRFAAKTNSVPILGNEFGEAAKELPIAFVKGDKGEFLPVVLLGLRDAENLFVAQDGSWNGRYIPAFIRRYPFAPADVGDGQMVVCLDESAACFSQEQGEPLFPATGDEMSPLLQRIVAVLQDYQEQALRTVEFGKRLAAADLLIESATQAKLPDGATFNLNGIFLVDESRFKSLDDAMLKEWFSTGELGLIYAHLISITNIQRLFEKLGQRLQSPPPAQPAAN